MLEGGRGVEEAGVKTGEGGVVIVAHGIPEGSGVSLRHLHDLVCIPVADEVGLATSRSGATVGNVEGWVRWDGSGAVRGEEDEPP